MSSQGGVKNWLIYLVKRQLGGGRGSKIADFETTQFMDIYDFFITIVESYMIVNLPPYMINPSYIDFLSYALI